MICKLPVSILILVFPLTIFAVCQETDEFGNVSYVDCSQAETKDAKPVDIQPTNTVNPNEYIPKSSSNYRTGKLSAAEKRKKRAVKRKELEAAKKALEEAKKIQEGDRQKTISGSRLTDKYLNRVKAAEERVKKAEKALK